MTTRLKLADQELELHTYKDWTALRFAKADDMSPFRPLNDMFLQNYKIGRGLNTINSYYYPCNANRSKSEVVFCVDVMGTTYTPVIFVGLEMA